MATKHPIPPRTASAAVVVAVAVFAVVAAALGALAWAGT